MTIQTLKKLWKSKRRLRSSYYDDWLHFSRKYVYILLCIAALLNILLLIPDLCFIPTASGRATAAATRGVFLLILLGFGLWIRKIRKFRSFSMIVTFCEAAALAAYLIIMGQYNEPNFMIQALGIVIFNLVVFLIPNRPEFMVPMAVIGSVAFFVCAHGLIRAIDPMEFLAAAAYVTATIVLCATSTYNTERHQYREFLSKRELEHISSTDYLTETANRFRLEEEAERWLKFCQRQELPLSLVFIDVDNLKEINDQYGHAIGDSVLVDLARLIQSKLRSSDILARWGGDEFVMLLPNAALRDAIQFTERIRDAIQTNRFVMQISVTCSYGVAEMKQDSDFRGLLCEADRLMYDGKRRGKGEIRYADGEGTGLAAHKTAEI